MTPASISRRLNPDKFAIPSIQRTDAMSRPAYFTTGPTTVSCNGIALGTAADPSHVMVELRDGSMISCVRGGMATVRWQPKTDAVSLLRTRSWQAALRRSRFFAENRR